MNPLIKLAMIVPVVLLASCRGGGGGELDSVGIAFIPPSVNVEPVQEEVVQEEVVSQPVKAVSTDNLSNIDTVVDSPQHAQSEHIQEEVTYDENGRPSNMYVSENVPDNHINPDWANRLRPMVIPSPIEVIVPAPRLSQSRLRSVEYTESYGHWLDAQFASHQMRVSYDDTSARFVNHIGVIGTDHPNCTVDGVNICLQDGEVPYQSFSTSRPSNILTASWQGPVAGQTSSNEYMVGSVGIDFRDNPDPDYPSSYYIATVDFSDNLPLYDFAANLDTSKEPFVIHGCEIGTGCYQTLSATFYKLPHVPEKIIAGRVQGPDFEGLYLVKAAP